MSHNPNFVKTAFLAINCSYLGHIYRNCMLTSSIFSQFLYILSFYLDAVFYIFCEIDFIDSFSFRNFCKKMCPAAFLPGKMFILCSHFIIVQCFYSYFISKYLSAQAAEDPGDNELPDNESGEPRQRKPP